MRTLSRDTLRRMIDSPHRLRPYVGWAITVAAATIASGVEQAWASVAKSGRLFEGVGHLQHTQIAVVPAHDLNAGSPEEVNPPGTEMAGFDMKLMYQQIASSRCRYPSSLPPLPSDG
jgi:hypothetical protein